VTPRTCKRVRRELPWFVGGDLPVARRAEVQEHLRGCFECRRDAASLQQSTKVLREVGERPAARIDEAMFADMHATILDGLDAELRADPPRPVLPRPLVSIAAAGVLFTVGWWFVRGPAQASVFERPPIVMPVGSEHPAAVPYSGPRVPLRLLGEEHPDREVTGTDGMGPGMMGRWRLRTLVDEGAPAPWEQTDAVERGR
jgi:hypothetical protein